MCLVSLPLFAFKKQKIITPIYNGQKSNQSFTKIFFREKVWKDNGLRISNIGSEVVKNCRAEKKNLFGLRRYSICATIRTHRDIECLPYAGLLEGVWTPPLFVMQNRTLNKPPSQVTLPVNQ